jgi:hypothetical protein
LRKNATLQLKNLAISGHVKEFLGRRKYIVMVLYIASIDELGNMLKEPTHIQAHLVFADTQANAEKAKELEFLPTHRRQK